MGDGLFIHQRGRLNAAGGLATKYIFVDLPDQSQPALRLEYAKRGCRCGIKIHGIRPTCDGIEANNSYAAALRYLLGEK